MESKGLEIPVDYNYKLIGNAGYLKQLLKKLTKLKYLATGN
jgi:hypothetical protein